MIPGVMPSIRKKPAPDPGGGYSFTMTAGDFTPIGGVPPGVVAGHFRGLIGSINAEPIPGYPIIACGSDSAGELLAPFPCEVLAFEGDAVSLLAGKSVWVDGVELLPILQDWTYNTSTIPPSTSIALGDGSLFQPSQQYFIEIK